MRSKRSCSGFIQTNLCRSSKATEQLDQLLGKHIPLGMLADIMVAYTLDLGIDAKSSCWRKTNVDRRVEVLFEYLSRVGRAGGAGVEFPPAFSDN